MGQRTTAKRAAALRQARVAKAARDAERLAREQRIEQALTDFYEATGIAEQIRADAHHRANKVLTEADARAQQADADARGAVRTLRQLGQTNADIAELCGITVAAVRAMANEADQDAETNGTPMRTPVVDGGDNATEGVHQDNPSGGKEHSEHNRGVVEDVASGAHDDDTGAQGLRQRSPDTGSQPAVMHGGFGQVRTER
jgi:predicted transcriptional regulator